MRQKGLRFGIFERLLVGCALVTLVPSLLLGGIAHGYLDKREESNANDRLQLVAARLAEQVDGWTRLNLDLMRMAAQMPGVSGLDAAQGANALRMLVAREPWMSNAHILDLSGTDLSRSDTKPLQGFADRRYFQDVRAGAPYSAEVIFSRTLKKPALSLAVPLKDDAGKLVAVLAASAVLDAITRSAQDAVFGKTGVAFLLQADGKLIADPRAPQSDDLRDFSAHPAYVAYKAGQPNPIHYTEGGRDIIAYVSTTDAGWINVVQQDLSESREALRQTDRISLLMLLPALALAILAAYLLARNFARPIRSLTDVADQISRGELDHDLAEIGRQDEIGDLARAIERLAKSMKLALARLRSR
jgi:methyl-accepting chemotaxis protein